MNLRAQTTLVCGALALAIALSTVLGGKFRKQHVLFVGFAADMALWYLSQSLFGFFQASVWERLRMVLAVLLPVFAVSLFEALVPIEGRRSRLGRVALVLAVPMLVLALSPYVTEDPVRVAIFVYVFGLVAAGLHELYRRGVLSGSRATQRRVRFLVVIGAIAAMFSVGDFPWIEGYDPPPVGLVVSVVFLFALAQALRHERLLDLYEMVGRLAVATVVAFVIAGLFYLLLNVIGPFQTMYLNAVLVAIVVQVLFNPLSDKVEQYVQRLFFRERGSLHAAVAEARRKLAHTLKVEEMATAVMAVLERSRSITSAALYLRDEAGAGFEKLAGFGRKAPEYVEYAPARALLERLERGTVLLDELRRQARGELPGGGAPSPSEALLAAEAVLGPMSGGVLLAIRAEGSDLLGLCVVSDERIRDAFTPEDVGVLEMLAAQIGVVVVNSRVYAKMQERDRLAVLGQMAAGLAHEIRNPLGAIKGAAQLLAEPGGGAGVDPSSQEFVSIIIEEVDRLNRVVGSVLDLARQNTDAVAPIDVNPVVRRTVQVMSAEWHGDDVEVAVTLGDSLPRTAIAAEQLQQVLMNLVRNAAQAMRGKGRIGIGTRLRESPSGTFIEIAVSDTGPGISRKALQSIFLPFFTTKSEGTGLGLAISQRIVQVAGGRIEVRTREGAGTTFTVILPAVMEALGTPTPGTVGLAARGAGSGAAERPSAPQPAASEAPAPAGAAGLVPPGAHEA
ncbi:MAG: two-component system sensor protein [Polyangiaceae bacterium]|nr:two-component system sensor protein [Polyangiaceae bacterium]